MMNPQCVTDGRRRTSLPGNPFSTRHTRPGMITPRTVEGEEIDLQAMIVRLLAEWGMTIVGPHGSGKTNLLAAIADAIECEGRRVTSIRARGIADALDTLRTIALLPKESVVCIDGWESLGWAVRLLATVFARWRRSRLVVTGHVEGGLPVLTRCATSPELLAAIVDALPDHGGRIDGTDIDEAFRNHEGNLREALYDLYDRFERRIRRISGCQPSTARCACGDADGNESAG